MGPVYNGPHGTSISALSRSFCTGVNVTTTGTMHDYIVKEVAASTVCSVTAFNTSSVAKSILIVIDWHWILYGLPLNLGSERWDNSLHYS